MIIVNSSKMRFTVFCNSCFGATSVPIIYSEHKQNLTYPNFKQYNTIKITHVKLYWAWKFHMDLDCRTFFINDHDSELLC